VVLNGDALVVSGDVEVADDVKEVTTNSMVWSKCSIASWDGEERWPECLRATVSFGWRWSALFTTKSNKPRLSEGVQEKERKREVGRRARGTVVTPESMKNGRSTGGLRRENPPAWRHLWLGKKRGNGEEGEGFIGEERCGKLLTETAEIKASNGGGFWRWLDRG
jgi:hypothetical protein